jgi:hypothetical protein
MHWLGNNGAGGIDHKVRMILRIFKSRKFTSVTLDGVLFVRRAH